MYPRADTESDRHYGTEWGWLARLDNKRAAAAAEEDAVGDQQLKRTQSGSSKLKRTQSGSSKLKWTQ